MKWALMILVAATLIGPVWAEEPLDEDFRLFMKYYQGEFNNHDQVQSENALAAELHHPWHHYTISRIEAPAFGEHVFFAQINDRGPDGEIVRQRLNVFDADTETGTIRQRFFAIEPGLEGVDFPVVPSDLAKLRPNDLRGYPEGCQVIWQRHEDRFLGTIGKGDCAVVSRRSGKTLLIWAEMVLSETEARHAEGGTDVDFNPIFGPPGGVPFKLRRVDGEEAAVHP